MIYIADAGRDDVEGNRIEFRFQVDGEIALFHGYGYSRIIPNKQWWRHCISFMESRAEKNFVFFTLGRCGVIYFLKPYSSDLLICHKVTFAVKIPNILRIFLHVNLYKNQMLPHIKTVHGNTYLFQRAIFLIMVNGK